MGSTIRGRCSRGLGGREFRILGLTAPLLTGSMGSKLNGVAASSPCTPPTRPNRWRDAGGPEKRIPYQSSTMIEITGPGRPCRNRRPRPPRQTNVCPVLRQWP